MHNRHILNGLGLPIFLNYILKNGKQHFEAITLASRPPSLLPNRLASQRNDRNEISLSTHCSIPKLQSFWDAGRHINCHIIRIATTTCFPKCVLYIGCARSVCKLVYTYAQGFSVWKERYRNSRSTIPRRGKFNCNETWYAYKNYFFIDEKCAGTPFWCVPRKKNLLYINQSVHFKRSCGEKIKNDTCE
jgi:hypothetical protein